MKEAVPRGKNGKETEDDDGDSVYQFEDDDTRLEVREIEEILRLQPLDRSFRDAARNGADDR